ncbi:MAG: SDR family NAD(P)-dependent oxidoreductase, partial [Silvanigrellaceae bacterium]|nr:SDR family NAD(P)-dependent oxidoreductase [Silvanigrellaceae bacterium]
MKNLYYAPQWIIKNHEEKALSSDVIFVYDKESEKFAKEISSYFPNANYILIKDGWLEQFQIIKTKHPLPTIYFISNHEIDPNKDPADIGWNLVQLVQTLKELEQLTLKVIVQNTISLNRETPLDFPADSVLLGLAQGIAKEFLSWSVCCISVDNITEKTIQFISSEKNQENENFDPIVIFQENRYIRQLTRTHLLTNKNSIFKIEGTYLIIGGMGGIGFSLARYLATKYKAKLIILGRKKNDSTKLNELRSLTSEVFYHQCDILKENEIKFVLSHYDKIDGVIHSALVLQDKTLLNMDENTFRSVLNPKVAGSINFHKAFQNKFPDFILYFSSVQTFISNAGQSNYSAACTFKDVWADYQNLNYKINTKIINWGFWGSVGVVAKPEYITRLQKLGIGSIQVEEGIESIETILKNNLSQVAALKAESEALKHLHIEIASKVPDSILFDIIPPYQKVSHLEESQDALENYTRFSIQNIQLPTQIIPFYTRLYQAIHNMTPGLPVNKQEILTLFPELSPFIKLLDHCLAHYPDVLTGKIDHMNVLFPEGKLDLVKAIYQNNPVADYFNSAVAKIVKNYQSLFPEKIINIIEIGAGTGSTTKHVLPILTPDKSSYLYTDISLGFVNHGRREFSEKYPFVNFEVVNIEQPHDSSHTYDILIATNVLHATKDIQQTLNNVRKLLKNDGIVIINEVTARQDFATLTFGLTTGWWLYTDYRIPDSPLMTSATWHSLLLETGFSHVLHYGGEEQQVIVGFCKEKPFLELSPYKKESKMTDLPTMEKTSAFLASPATSIHSLLLNYLREKICAVIRLPADQMKEDITYENYGIDSLIVLEIVQSLSKDLGYLPSTILFEYPTLSKLTSYFEKNHSETVNKIFKVENDTHNLIQKESFTTNVDISTLSNDVAIIGMSLKLPKANSIEEFWNNLKTERDCVTSIPTKRWDFKQYYNEHHGELNSSYSYFGAFIDGEDEFDYEFFGITPLDAENLDPQERIALQKTYHALEDTGYSPSALKEKNIGVYVGVMNNSYGLFAIDSNYKENYADSHHWSIANRISYFFDFYGPSLAIDTACSASLSALHIACQDLKSGECPLAIIIGVNLIVHPHQYNKLCHLHMLTADNKCKTFSKNADGFVDGEGIIVMVLKRYKEALEDGDQIYGVIRGSGVNSGGKTSGYTVPNPTAQSALIQKVLERSGVEANSISYIEA